MRYGKIDKKDEDDPDPAYLTPCGEIQLRRDSTSSDGINSSIRLEKKHLNAEGVKENEPVRVYVEAHGRWAEYERDTYSDRPGVGLPQEARENLNLSPGDTIDVWIGKVEDHDQEQLNTADDTTAKKSRNESGGKRKYIWLFDEGPVYHHIRLNNKQTACGVDFSELKKKEDYKLLSDPGDVLEECQECQLRATGDMTNRELVQWIGDENRADFDVGTDAPAYLSKSQLTKIRDYIIDLEMDLKESRKDEGEVKEDEPTIISERN